MTFFPKLPSTFALALGQIAFAQGPPKPVLTVEDLTPKFLTFYQAASKQHADEQQRWEFTPNWFARAEQKQAAILADIAPHLAESDSAAIMRYTMGTGGAGVEREAYLAGWLVIGDLLAHGWTFPRLARVTDSQMTGLVSESLRRIQKAKR